MSEHVEGKCDCERLRAAIRDIDAHATPFGTDEDGFVNGGYLISVGSLHRALALTGTAPLCRVCTPESHDCPERSEATSPMGRLGASGYVKVIPERSEAPHA